MQVDDILDKLVEKGTITDIDELIKWNR